MDRTLKELAREQHMILASTFIQGQTLSQVADVKNVSKRTLQRHMDALLDTLRAKVSEAGVTELPRGRF